MNILYIIGNGFDLAQGLHTLYTDFYPNYLKAPSPNKVIERLKKEIGEHYNTWAALEEAFGKYTHKIESHDDLDIVYFDILDHLREYLLKEEGRFEVTVQKTEKILDDLFEPDQYLEGTEQKRFYDYMNRWNNHNWTQHVITLNYTRIFEELVGFENMTLPLTKRFVYANNQLKDVIHLHGTLDGTMLLGVNDETQIANPLFQQSLDAKELLVKPATNDNLRNDLNERCRNLIVNANLLVVHGTSMGITDKKWWTLIGQQLKRSDFRILYFYHGDKNVPSNRKQLLGRMTRLIGDELIFKLGITDKTYTELEDKIFIAINKPMFSTIDLQSAP